MKKKIQNNKIPKWHMICEDCIDRPRFYVKDMFLSTTMDAQLCNRHFYLFAKKFEKWFLEDELLYK